MHLILLISGIYYTYNMGNQDLPDIYTLALGPAALGLRYIYIRQIPLATHGGKMKWLDGLDACLVESYALIVFIGTFGKV